MTREELYKEAMEAFKNPDTRLSKNLRMHRERYLLRNKDKLTEKNNKDLDKLKVQPKLEGNYPELSEEQLDKFKEKKNKGDMVKSRTGPQDFRKGGMVLSTVDNRKK